MSDIVANAATWRSRRFLAKCLPALPGDGYTLLGRHRLASVVCQCDCLRSPPEIHRSQEGREVHAYKSDLE